MNGWHSLKGVSLQAALPEKKYIKELLCFISMYWGKTELLRSFEQAPLYSYYFSYSMRFTLEVSITLVSEGLPRNKPVVCGSALANEGLYEFRWGSEETLSLLKEEKHPIPLMLSEPDVERYMSVPLSAYPLQDSREAELFIANSMNGV